MIKKDIAHINFTLRYLQLYLLFSCIAEARFFLFPGRKILVLLGQHIVEKDVVLERTVYVVDLVESRTYASGQTNNVTANVRRIRT